MASRRRPFMSSFKKPPSTSFEDLTPVANSDSQNHSANPSNQGSSFASIGNLQSMNSIEDSLPGFFDQHHSENRSNRGSSSASIGDLQSLNSIDNSLPESFDQVEGDQECSVEIDKKHLKWNNQMDVVFMDSLLDQMLKGQKIGGSFTSSAYRAASNAVSTKFSVHCDSSHVRNRLKTLKRNLAMAKDMLTTDSGFGYNHSTQLIEATAGVWAAYLKVYLIQQMAMQAASPATALPGAQVVGNAFVEQYYHILHESPELVYKFYQDSSVLSRPNSNGVMTSVTTMQAINDRILSLDYGNYKAEIKTADAQESYKEGVIVLVTGYLTGKDNVRRKFTQTFFLAPQEKGYFVLNDVFRYVEESESLEVNSMSVNGINDNTLVSPLPSDPEPIRGPDHSVLEPAVTFEAEDINNGAEVCDPSDHEEESVIEGEVIDEPPTHSSEIEANTVVNSDTSAAQEGKKSYASIVKVTKVTKAFTPVYVPTSRMRVAPANADQQSVGPAKPAPELEASAPVSDIAPESTTAHEEVEGHSIYIRNLPLNATVTQLEEEFIKFGRIKHGGIQVRSNKQQGFCFGFVEFESLDSMQAAIQASPLTIRGHQAVVEEKRTTTRVGSSGRGRYTSGRGGFRNDSFRNRGHYGGGRAYSRNEFRNQGEFSGRPKGPSGRNGEGYQRVDQNGSGRGGRQGGMNNNKSVASG
ncbi:Nuclear transport factor 2 [Camellia lanceoleosa]|uniref:Nuclear transport factor 2 n=1 Tax=Camellia lanceoleosa TaxID=1840588 RepID=A0ACC0I272_9ERIC|nr:Nuclear transport factor 2 [Camellia lanceoleosa]